MKRILIVSLLIASFVFTQTPLTKANQEKSLQQAQASNQIEPNAGNWRTWVISSGEDYLVAPPPNPAETQCRIKIARRPDQP